MRNLEHIRQFDISFNGRFVHIRLADNFDINSESMPMLWQATIKACHENKCSLVLSEGRVRSRHLQTSEAYDSGEVASTVRGLRQACLFYDYKPDKLSEFFKTVAANRGVSIEFFTDRKSALEWLGFSDEFDI